LAFGIVTLRTGVAQEHPAVLADFENKAGDAVLDDRSRSEEYDDSL
jgi:hypothetical protein